MANDKILALTDNTFKNKLPKDKVYLVGDGQGLSLRVRPNGKKSWIFEYYQPFTKKRIKMSFGGYPEVSLKQARALRVINRELVAQNIDPIEDRDKHAESEKVKADNVFKAVAEKWYLVKISDTNKISETHAKKIKRRLDIYIYPALANVPIDKLTPKKCIDALMPLSKRGINDTVKRCCSLINEVMTYSANIGLIDFNRLTGITKAFPAVISTPQKTITPDQMPRLMRAINFSNLTMQIRLLLELQLHTMVRPAEIIQAQWGEVNFEKALWTIPKEHMKMKKREHIVPLTQQALSLFKQLKEINGHREHVFPARNNPRTHSNPECANKAIKRIGFKDELVAHGFRSLASTTLNEKDFAPDVIESALAHTDRNQVRKAYNRAKYLDQRREMMQWWSDFISESSRGSLSLVVNEG